MSIAQRLLVAAGVAVWGAGLYVLANGTYGLGGGLMILVGLCFVIAASGGWVDFFDGLTNWLYFWR